MEHKIYYLYMIKNIMNEKVYIGQTINPARRWKDHKWLAQNKQEQYIHRAMNKYGIDNFEFEVIAACKTSEDVDETEKILISQYKSQNNEKGYNIAPGGDPAWNRGLPKEQQPMYGKHQSDYQKQRCSETHLGIKSPHTEETKNKMSNTRKGMTKNKEWIEKIASAHRGIKQTDEAKKKMSDGRKGIIFSESHKNNISKANSGENAHLAKLTWEIVAVIRLEYTLGNISMGALSKRYNVSKVSISNIINNKTWVI